MRFFFFFYFDATMRSPFSPCHAMISAITPILHYRHFAMPRFRHCRYYRDLFSYFRPPLIFAFAIIDITP